MLATPVWQWADMTKPEQIIIGLLRDLREARAMCAEPSASELKAVIRSVRADLASIFADFEKRITEQFVELSRFVNECRDTLLRVRQRRSPARSRTGLQNG